MNNSKSTRNVKGAGGKSGNEMVGPQNRPGGSGYGGGSGTKGGGTKNEMVMPANRPGGLGYGKK